MSSALRSAPVKIKFENAKKQEDGSYLVESGCSDFHHNSDPSRDEPLALEIAGIPCDVSGTDYPPFNFYLETTDGVQQGYIEYGKKSPWWGYEPGRICKFTGTDCSERPEDVQAIIEDGQSGRLVGVLSEMEPDISGQGLDLPATDQGEFAIIIPYSYTC